MHTQAGQSLPSLQALATHVSDNHKLTIGDEVKFLMPRQGDRGRCGRRDAEVLSL